jgi:hypothetical protein
MMMAGRDSNPYRAFAPEELARCTGPMPSCTKHFARALSQSIGARSSAEGGEVLRDRSLKHADLFGDRVHLGEKSGAPGS